MKRIIIIGAGILGASTAFELAKKGHEVLIIERQIKGRATSAAAGIINPWISKRRNKAWYELARRGAAYYPKLIHELEEVGEKSTGYKQVGAIKLHDNVETLEALRVIAEKRRALAPEIGHIKLLNKKETKEKFPFLEEKYCSLFISGAARVDGSHLRDALLNAARHYGAKIIDGEAQLRLDGDTITGITVQEDFHSADTTIATNGVWMNELFKDLETNIHFKAQKGEIIHLHTNDVETNDLPVVIPPNNQYLLSFNHGKIVVGATHESTTSFYPKQTAGGMHYILDQALTYAPGLENSEIVETRVGFRPFTANHLPVFGPLPNYNNLIIANGLGASGLTTGPFIATQLAKIATGERLDVDLANYDIRMV